jgi:catechol 2,3-dioxygenase-like lactoylglutathione lyase family enzyme
MRRSLGTAFLVRYSVAIIGMHALMYSKKDEATRAFFRDVLGFPSVDAGHGWLIFAAPPTELAIHPAEDTEYHELYLMCDDIDATVAELKTKGVVTRPIQERPWGRLTQLSLPSGEELGIYEPRHPTAISTSR